VLPGETALAFYTATNNSSEDIIGVATYSVTPGQVAQYFSKIQCFCFEEQRLNAGETVDMPVFFYIDPEFVNDPNMKGIEQVTLSYTFFSKYFLSWKLSLSERVSNNINRSKIRKEWAIVAICCIICTLPFGYRWRLDLVAFALGVAFIIQLTTFPLISEGVAWQTRKLTLKFLQRHSLRYCKF
jgi:hypothetical protein